MFMVLSASGATTGTVEVTTPSSTLSSNVVFHIKQSLRAFLDRTSQHPNTDDSRERPPFTYPSRGSLRKKDSAEFTNHVRGGFSPAHFCAEAIRRRRRRDMRAAAVLYDHLRRPMVVLCQTCPLYW